MRSSMLAIMLLGVLSTTCGLFPNKEKLTEKGKEFTPVAQMTRNGVEVRINQIQIQRLGGVAKPPELLKVAMNDMSPLGRTIAFSISQKGQGTSVGPTFIKLASGKVVQPFLTGNQQLMSDLATATPPEGFDFGENWFAIPKDSKFSDIFPITVVHNTTNKRQESVKFELTDIEP